MIYYQVFPEKIKVNKLFKKVARFLEILAIYCLLCVTFELNHKSCPM